MIEENLGDPYVDGYMKGRYERIRRWWNIADLDSDQTHSELKDIAYQKDGRFGGNKFFKAEDVVKEVRKWIEAGLTVKRFGLEGTKNLKHNDLILETLLIETEDDLSGFSPLLHGIHPEEYGLDGKHISMSWWD